MRLPNCLTASFDARSVASLPSSTSAIPPLRASMTNLRSPDGSVPVRLSDAALSVAGGADCASPHAGASATPAATIVAVIHRVFIVLLLAEAGQSPNGAAQLVRPSRTVYRNRNASEEPTKVGRGRQFPSEKATDVCSLTTMGRKRSGRPTESFSKGTSTIRPKIDAPSFSLTTPTAYGASAACRAGATRMMV